MTTILRPRRIKIIKREIPLLKSVATLVHRKLTADEIKRIVDQEEDNNDWTYIGSNGPEHWHRCYPVAASTYQSPVDLNIHDAKYDDSLSDLVLSGYEETRPDEKLRIINNGCTVKVSLESGITISRSDFTSTYEALYVCFHWGDDNTKGSEHQINGKSYPMEIQIIHKNVKYTEDEMFDKQDGLLMLAYFAEIGDNTHESLKSLTDNLIKIKHKGDEAEIDNFPLRSMLPANVSKYFQYVGSLTTPPCNECVTWVILSDTVHISQQQLHNFRTLYCSGKNSNQPLTNNFRPIQKLYNRKIKTNSEFENGYSFNTPTIDH